MPFCPLSPTNTFQFQDALSIIFDKGAEKPAEGQTLSDAVPLRVSPIEADDSAQNDESSITYANMDMDESSNGIMAASNMDLDEQTQYQMIYGSMGDYTSTGVVGTVYGDIASEVALPTSNSSADSAPSIPAEPTEMSDLVLGTVDKSIPLPNEQVDIGVDISQVDDAKDADSEAIRSQELDDMAMLGIDVEDMAAQCF